jgi:hypothetical protein
MTDEQRVLAERVQSVEFERQKRFQCAKVLRSRYLPGSMGDGYYLPEVAELLARREAIARKETERLQQEYAQRPIDDAAWAKELERRAMIDAGQFFTYTYSRA